MTLLRFPTLQCWKHDLLLKAILIMSAQSKSGVVLAARYAVPFVLLLIPIWLSRINAHVPEPYLDEAFHIPQAQAYWAHKWTHWDPKITTPPGLYLWSYGLCAALLSLRGSPAELTPEVLRATNVAATAIALPYRLQKLLDRLRKTRNTRPSGAWLSHTVLNICLFPPIFFFSGLYYTDILALLVIVEAYNWDLKRSSGDAWFPLKTIVFTVLGLVTLVFRQTNIFWAAIFLGGLQVVRQLKLKSKPCRSSGLADVVRQGWQNELYDPLVSEASIEDYFKTSISLLSVALSNLGTVISTAIPYLLILAGFGAFVLWNDGVVLGHKEFHTAGIHLPQMLYIWPFIVFFSWPLLLGPVINLALPKSFLPKFIDFGFPKKQKGFPKLLTAITVIPIMLVVVHFNTIVHPFTLADNRHYVFYAFRILLRTHPATKYAAVVVYFLCAWMVISALGFSTTPQPPQMRQITQPAAWQYPELQEEPMQKEPTQKKAERKQKAAKQKTSKQPAKAPVPQPISEEAFAKIQAHLIQRQKQQQGAPQVSFVLVWLAATVLSLITAPLVEPRYFIIPWVMWRLHLPPQPTPLVHRRPQHAIDELNAKMATNFPLFLETYWFLVINAVTASLCRSITPPPVLFSRSARNSAPQTPCLFSSPHKAPLPKPNQKILPSPIQLTHIRDFAPSSGKNVDTVRLRDILGDPMIRECWQFNYLHDVDFLMSQFDEDVRALVKLKVVHGSWKRDAPNRVRIDEACTRYPNVEAIVAYMPEAFGTHHSKMMILLRHDDYAQVIIHTANMIPGDWANMTQALWRSPLLPLVSSTRRDTNADDGQQLPGSGARFKRDLLAYLSEYGSKKTGPLVKQLSQYDFRAVRAALVASVPSKQKLNEADSRVKTLWGWVALKDVLKNVPALDHVKKNKQEQEGGGGKRRPHIVVQISSVASLGQSDKWLKEVLFASLAPKVEDPKPRYSIIFPTPDEIRRSLNGYGSGGSIHMKLQSAAQQRQLQYLRPFLCRWAGDDEEKPAKPRREAGRRRAAPHIKTYIRFSSEDMTTIDWAMVTSANLSTQAWGAAVNANGEVRICSWEIGVVVWPELLTRGPPSTDTAPAETAMVPCCKTDTPLAVYADAAVTVGFRMPYDLPLSPFRADDIPWCATASHSEPDWLGQTWEG
ncbi:phospholipase D/nuclease [Aspergillus saccharolyticus JOP 1030-1]|uniref:Dol-P-Glc:Glc(2)Man(9)GlcNAc(2)-PP-Dol alpha-1,2-glucosyltransferase n=1 Tax=Aspergillus saccharolyticus JOP 1030-1 TaxID=1450539 RepID=A0A318ZCI4_9EURO|nr:phospholipase D/nuclease [Aspergillus saccharolyticus JOP 1030-1]PYH45156.1 phospholipase D/nuclease [Aspergillus saccharolyticus JOP 1030-1]